MKYEVTLKPKGLPLQVVIIHADNETDLFRKVANKFPNHRLVYWRVL